MNILSVTSEIYPLIKTGGLADVTGSLPKALEPFGAHTRTLLPGYPKVMKQLGETRQHASFHNLFGAEARLLSATVEGLFVYILDAPEFYDRPGGPYVNEAGKDHPDNWKRFAALSRVGAEIAGGLLPDWKPDLVHTHDWQSALTSVYMHYGRARFVPSVLTVHNLAFQGQFSAELFDQLELPSEAFSVNCLEYYGDISYLKGGLQTANAISTVSPTYVRETLTPEFGMGLDGVLNERLNDLRGIVNGIDVEVWNPSSDPYLIQNYSTQYMRRRYFNRMRLIEEFGIDDDRGPIFAVVSRLTWQKGVDMLPDVVDDIVAQGGKLIVLGQGDSAIEDALRATALRHPGRVSVTIGYKESLAHLIHGGADSVLQPSRFEPCGLTQLYALRYGCVPIVSRTGGLSETIIDANEAAMSARVATGFQFHPIDADGLRLALMRVFEAYQKPKVWARLQHQAMKADFSWERSAGQYAELYQSVLQQAAAA